MQFLRKINRLTVAQSRLLTLTADNWKKDKLKKTSKEASKPKGPYDALHKNMAKFQVEDGLPVFLKGGVVDKAMYYATLALCGGGVLWVVTLLYDQAKPNSWKTSD